MDIIYRSAVATIVDMDGKNSDHGLPGVRHDQPRFPQCEEIIFEKSISTIPPHLVQLVEGTSWLSRAWTLQEGLLPHRRVLFSEYQMHFFCRKANWSECIDDSFDPGEYLCSGTVTGRENSFWVDNVRSFDPNLDSKLTNPLASESVRQIHSRRTTSRS
jgi:hypothetical protein